MNENYLLRKIIGLNKGASIFVLLYSLIFISLFSLGFSSWHQTQVPPEIDIQEILKASAIYCHKLEHAAIDFVCLEEITEKVNYSRDATSGQSWRELRDTWSVRKVRLTEVKNEYLYDFQYVRKNDQFKEIRTLLKENGQKRNEKEAKLKTINFLFKNVLMGPVGILAEPSQINYDYKILSMENLYGIPAVILDIIPKPDYKSETLFGKVWLDRSRMDILKIEWSQKNIGNFQIFEERAEKFKSEPLITMISEFAVEKNGIRFPSRFLIEEAYVNKKGKKFVRSETTVIYRDFKFFKVEVEIKK